MDRQSGGRGHVVNGDGLVVPGGDERAVVGEEERATAPVRPGRAATAIRGRSRRRRLCSVFAVPSANATANREPFGDIATACGRAGKRDVATALPSARVQTFAVLSALDGRDLRGVGGDRETDDRAVAGRNGLLFLAGLRVPDAQVLVVADATGCELQSGVTAACRTGPAWAAWATRAGVQIRERLVGGRRNDPLAVRVKRDPDRRGRRAGRLSCGFRSGP